MLSRPRKRQGRLSLMLAVLGAVAALLSPIAGQPVAAAPVTTWTGASVTSTNWSDPANWVGGIPLPGDAVVFPAATARRDASGFGPTNNDLLLGLGITVDSLSSPASYRRPPELPLSSRERP